MTLLHEVTKEKYKYYPASLPDKTTSPVVIQCDFCRKTYEMPWKKFVQEIGRNSKLHACTKCVQILQHYVKTDRSVNPYYYREDFILNYIVLDHIDFEETKKLYRYDPRKIGYNEVEGRMMVVIRCARCNDKRSVHLENITKHAGYTGLCKKCGKQVSDKVVNKQEAPQESGAGLVESEKHPGIFRQATIDKLGIDPDTLAPNSGSPVIAKCCICKGPVETKLAYFNKQAGRISCSKECRKTLYNQNLSARYS